MAGSQERLTVKAYQAFQTDKEITFQFLFGTENFTDSLRRLKEAQQKMESRGEEVTLSEMASDTKARWDGKQ